MLDLGALLSSGSQEAAPPSRGAEQEPANYHGPHNREKRRAQAGTSLFGPLELCKERCGGDPEPV